MDAIAGEDQEVAGLEGEIPVVDAHVDVDAQGPIEAADAIGEVGGMVAAELLQIASPKKIGASVTHMEEMGGLRLQNQGGEGRDTSSFGGAVNLALIAEPAIEGGEDAMSRCFGAPTFGRLVVVGEEPADRGFTGFFGGSSGGNSVGNHRSDTLRYQGVIVGKVYADKVFIDLLCSCGRHRSYGKPDGTGEMEGGNGGGQWAEGLKLGESGALE